MTDLDLCCSLLTAEKNAATKQERGRVRYVKKRGSTSFVRTEVLDSCEKQLSRQTGSTAHQTFSKCLAEGSATRTHGHNVGLSLTLLSSSILLMSNGLLEEFSK